jgi:hypothetical protein
MAEQMIAARPTPKPDTGNTLKALVAGLAAWNAVEAGQPVSDRPLDMGYLFDLGIAYAQAKIRNPERIDALADAAASASPLAKVPHRLESGRLAIAALLRAMGS